MGSKNHHLSPILFFICTVHFACNADAGGPMTPISSFCLSAIDKTFCSRVVLGAKTWDEAMLKAIQTTTAQLLRSKPKVDDLMTELPPTLSPEAKLNIVQTCKKSYESITNEIAGSLQALKRGGEPSKLNLMFSAASSDLGDCSRALRDFHVPGKIGLYECNYITANLINTCSAVNQSGDKQN